VCYYLCQTLGQSYLYHRNMAIADNSGNLQVKSPSRETRLEFAKLLAGNDKKIRDRGLKKLKKWLTVRSLGNYGE